MITPVAAVSDDQRVLVTFRLEHQIYALPIEPVAQIIEMVALTPLPQVHPAIKGIVNWHGTLAPVIDLRRYWCLPEAPLRADTHIILVRAHGRVTGLLVDAVMDVLDLHDRHVIRPADILPIGLNDTSPMIEGLAHTPAGLIVILDLEQLVTHSALNLAEVSSALAASAQPTLADAEQPHDLAEPARLPELMT